MLDVASFVALLEQHREAAYAILFIGAYFETFIVTSFFVYGEVFFIGGGILAGAGFLNLGYVIGACVIGGVAGDTSSYFLGRSLGPRVVKRLFKPGNRLLTLENYRKVSQKFMQYGAKAVFVARFLGPISWVTPFFAGTVKMRYRDFLPFNAVGATIAISWGVYVGYFSGFAYAKLLGGFAPYVVVGVGIVLAAFLLYRAVRPQRPADATRKSA